MGWSMGNIICANASSTCAPLRETVLVAEAQHRGVQTIALVLDNGSTHAFKQLPLWVKELVAKSEGKLTVQLFWLPTNASWLDQMEIWFSLLQRKLLQPNHISSHQELERAILDCMTHYNQAAKPLKWSYTVEHLEHKLATRLGGGAKPEDERVA
jgi:DDE superfamily endonuclease